MADPGTVRIDEPVLGIKHVRGKPVRVKAVEVTISNIESLALWIAGGVTLGTPKASKLVYLCAKDYYCKDAYQYAIEDQARFPHIHILTPEGSRPVFIGDYIIRGTIGEFYPIKAEVFRNSYDDVVDGE